MSEKDIDGIDEDAASSQSNTSQNREADLLFSADKRSNLSHKELLVDRQHNRWVRWVVSIIASGVPLLLLGVLYYLLLSDSFEDMKNKWVPIVLISGTFLTFISIYGILLTGLYRRHSQNDKEEENGGLEKAVRMIVNARRTGGGE